MRTAFVWADDAFFLGVLVIEFRLELLTVGHFLIVSYRDLWRSSCLADVLSIFILFVAASSQRVCVIARVVVGVGGRLGRDSLRHTLNEGDVRVVEGRWGRMVRRGCLAS